jgi:hypothetical protein
MRFERFDPQVWRHNMAHHTRKIWITCYNPRLGAVSGWIDHLAIDLKRKCLFVAERGNASIGLVDIAANRIQSTMPGLKEPQGGSLRLNNRHDLCRQWRGRIGAHIAKRRFEAAGAHWPRRWCRQRSKSLMPDLAGGNINASVIMIAEKTADLIRGREPAPVNVWPRLAGTVCYD